jgi:xanthine dehydrogenase accessory factor
MLAQESRRPEVLTLNLDDNFGWDDGLICGGRMRILADPMTSLDRGPVLAFFLRFHELAVQGRGATEALVFEDQDGVPIGSRFLFDEHGQPVGHLGAAIIPATVTNRIVPLSQRPAPSLQHGVALLPLLPRLTLLIVGGGHVGQAVARLAAEVDFDIWVLDDRAVYVSAERFPWARRRIVGDVGGQLRDLLKGQITASTYCIIVTRGHQHDEEALSHLAAAPAGYVGMIGSRRKIRLIFEDLTAKGVAPEVLARIHAPLGLDIGSRTIPEIAVSIVAELIAHRNKIQIPNPKSQIPSHIDAI